MAGMSDLRRSTLLAALGEEPLSTSDLYDRIGYRALIRVGLVPYPAFRATLVELQREGLVESAEGTEGATVWKRA